MYMDERWLFICQEILHALLEQMIFDLNETTIVRQSITYDMDLNRIIQWNKNLDSITIDLCYHRYRQGLKS